MMWIHWSTDKNPNTSIWSGKSFNHSRWHLAEKDADGYYVTNCGKDTAEAKDVYEAPVVGVDVDPPDYFPMSNSPKPIPVCKTCRFGVSGAKGGAR